MMLDTRPLNDPEVLQLEPILTIRHGSVLKDKLLAALSRSDAVELSIDKNSEADLSFVQLIEAARLQASRQGKALSLASPVEGSVLETLERAGLTTAMTSQSRAFWFHEKEKQ
ncbi:MAG: STAS domain-containing protein [Rhizobium sp.]|nr:STAS domain-containing protein [Rhizobium sp.]